MNAFLNMIISLFSNTVSQNRLALLTASNTLTDRKKFNLEPEVAQTQWKHLKNLYKTLQQDVSVPQRISLINPLWKLRTINYLKNP